MCRFSFKKKIFSVWRSSKFLRGLSLVTLAHFAHSVARCRSSQKGLVAPPEVRSLLRRWHRNHSHLRWGETRVACLYQGPRPSLQIGSPEISPRLIGCAMNVKLRFVAQLNLKWAARWNLVSRSKTYPHHFVGQNIQPLSYARRALTYWYVSGSRWKG